MPGTPDWVVDGYQSKTEVLVWYRLSNLIKAVAEDASVKASKKNAKR